MTMPQAAIGGELGEILRPELAQPLQAPSQSEAQQHRSTEQRVEHGQTRLGDGVVGGTLMVGQADAGCKCLGHCGTMRQYMCGMTLRQPQSQQSTQ